LCVQTERPRGRDLCPARIDGGHHAPEVHQLLREHTVSASEIQKALAAAGRESSTTGAARSETNRALRAYDAGSTSASRSRLRDYPSRLVSRWRCITPDRALMDARYAPCEVLRPP
jgi:hypothetical protein